MPGIHRLFPRSKSCVFPRTPSSPLVPSIKSAKMASRCTPQYSLWFRTKRGSKKVPLTAPDECSRRVEAHAPQLEQVMADKLLSKLFREWAEENVCSENLNFYYEVEKYKTIRDPNFRKGEAFRIYAKFVRPRSVAQVNLDYDCQSTIEAQLESPTPNTFDEAKVVVTDMIKYDLYRKFLDSELYREYKGFPNMHRASNPRRRNFQIAELPHLTFDQISTLAKCLSDPLALDEFLKFTYNEFSDGLVQFYLDVNNYEMSPSVGFATEIFNKYLGAESEEEVDADPKMKLRIWQQIESGQCPADLFRHLKVQVYAVMVQDNFMRFQNYVISSLALV